MHRIQFSSLCAMNSSAAVFPKRKIRCFILNDDNATITDLPGHGVEHLFFWNDDPKQCFPPHLGVGLSHTRSLRCCPGPQGLALQSDHIDQVDQPPVTNHKNIAIS